MKHLNNRNILEQNVGSF